VGLPQDWNEGLADLDELPDEVVEDALPPWHRPQL
jgi:hypothetical protein